MLDVQGYNRSLRMLQAFMEVHHEKGERQRRLSTGTYANSAEEDSARASLALKLESRIRGQAQALANIEDAKALLTIKEAGLHTAHQLLITMQEKAIQGANDTLDAGARQLINQELQSLSEELTSTLRSATYGDVSLNDETAFSIQVDAESGDTFVIENSEGGPQTVALGDLNEGIASWDALSGTGYIMYTEEDIFSRFGANPGIDRADHLVAVINQGGQWYWSAWHGLTPFTPTNSDRLLAEVDFDADTVQNLEGVSTRIDGINAGYNSGDLVITPNQFGNPPAPSPEDFSVQGSFVVTPSQTLADEIAFSSSQLNVLTSASARSLMGEIETALETINSEIQELGSYQQVLSAKGMVLNESKINQTEGYSRINDADFVKEQIEIVKLDIMQNAGVAALSQYISDAELVLQLL